MIRGTANIVLLALVALAAASCDGDTQEPAFLEVTGRWAGEQDGLRLELTLSEQINGDVAGAGTLRRAPGAATLAVRADGVHAPPDVSLTISSASRPDINFSGEFNEETRILGALNGDGLEDMPLILVRERVPEDPSGA